MAVYCELNDLVNHLRSKTQSFYETLKRDAIAEQLYSPEAESEAYFSRSLEKDQALLIQQIQIAHGKPPAEVCVYNYKREKNETIE